MIRDVINGLLGFIGAFNDLGKYKLWKFVWISGVLSLLVASVFFFFIYQYYDDLGGWASNFYKWETGSTFISKLLNFISGAIMIISVMLVFKYIILILVSPIMSLVSEKVEKQISLEPAQAGAFNFSAIIRGLRLSLSNIFRELGLTLALLVVSIFPFVGIVSAPAIFIVQAYYAGFGNMDYTMERYYNIPQSRSFVSRNKGIAIGNGVGYVLLLMIPIVGLFFAPILATVSCTKAVLRKRELLT